jgi:hypothetical protein
VGIKLIREAPPLAVFEWNNRPSPARLHLASLSRRERVVSWRLEKDRRK